MGNKQQQMMTGNSVNGMGINYLLAERKQSDRRRIDHAMTSIKPEGVGRQIKVF